MSLDLSGPMGGALAAAFAAGASGGFAFTMAMTRERIAELKAMLAEAKAEAAIEAADLRDQIRMLQSFALNGDVRQMAQLHSSTIALQHRRNEDEHVTKQPGQAPD